MTKYKKTVTFFLFPEGQMRLFSFLYYGFVYSILQMKLHIFDTKYNRHFNIQLCTYY